MKTLKPDLSDETQTSDTKTQKRQDLARDRLQEPAHSSYTKTAQDDQVQDMYEESSRTTQTKVK